MILITGGVGSGTTFMASLFQASGYDLGDQCHQNNQRNAQANSQVRGMEHYPLFKLLGSWNMRFLPNIDPQEMRAHSNPDSLFFIDDPTLANIIAPEVAEVSANLPIVIKNPNMMRWLGLWLLAGGATPDLVIIMIRDTLDQAISNYRDEFSKVRNPIADRGDTLINYGFLYETLVRYNIRSVAIPFPQCVTNPVHLAETLAIPPSQHKEFVAAHQSVANPDLIRTSSMGRLLYQESYREEHDPYGMLVRETDIENIELRNRGAASEQHYGLKVKSL